MAAVTSDSEATVSALLLFLQAPPFEAIDLAKKRGVPGVVKLLLPDTKVDGEEEREALRDAVLANTAQLLDQIPRDVEFTYNQKIDKLRPLFEGDALVPYTTLLKHLQHSLSSSTSFFSTSDFICTSGDVAIALFDISSSSSLS